MSQDKHGKGDAGHEERRRRPGKVGNCLAGADPAQILELLVVPDVVQLVHKRCPPRIQLDALHVVDDLGDEPAPGVLVLHLLLLQVLHVASNESVDGNHEDHNTNS